MFGCLTLGVHELTIWFWGLVNVSNQRVISHYYDIERVKATVWLFFIKHSKVEAYWGADLYIHVFLTTAIVTDVQLSLMFDSYLPAKKTQN
jgi:hypothetical protein